MILIQNWTTNRLNIYDKLLRLIIDQYAVLVRRLQIMRRTCLAIGTRIAGNTRAGVAIHNICASSCVLAWTTGTFVNICSDNCRKQSQHFEKRDRVRPPVLISPGPLLWICLCIFSFASTSCLLYIISIIIIIIIIIIITSSSSSSSGPTNPGFHDLDRQLNH